MENHTAAMEDMIGSIMSISGLDHEDATRVFHEYDILGCISYHPTIGFGKYEFTRPIYATKHEIVGCLDTHNHMMDIICNMNMK